MAYKRRHRVHDFAEAIAALLAPNADPELLRLEGPGFTAYRYRPAGPGSETIVIQLQVGESFKERFKLTGPRAAPKVTAAVAPRRSRPEH